MKIYLIAGKSGSGKGEVAKIIKQYYILKNKKVIITEFSKYLKMYAKEIIKWNGIDPKPRKFLQDLGVIIREDLGMPKFFINRLIEDLKIYELYYDVVIISDTRLPEEIEELKKVYKNITSIYLINQFEPSKLSIEEQMHITEIALENYRDFDITFINDNLNNLNDLVINYIESSEEK